METEAQLIVERATLRWLSERYPDWTQPELASELGQIGGLGQKVGRIAFEKPIPAM
jgi:hypothetical protein